MFATSVSRGAMPLAQPVVSPEASAVSIRDESLD